VCSSINLLSETDLEKISMTKFYQLVFDVYPEHKFNLANRKLFIKECVRKYMQKSLDDEQKLSDEQVQVID